VQSLGEFPLTEDPTSGRERGGGTRSLEVRWIRRGAIPDAMLDALGPFDDEIERREDRYLIDPLLPQLGVKIRGSTQLDLKAFRGDMGELFVEGLGRGRMERWEKWTFQLDGGATGSRYSSSWLTVRKVRRRRSFAFVDGHPLERRLSEAELPGCSVELTEAIIGGARWWTVGLEARGGDEGMELELRIVAASLLRAPLPVELLLETRDSMSYVRWLGVEFMPSA
jgi:hypothetical protein